MADVRRFGARAGVTAFAVLTFLTGAGLAQGDTWGAVETLSTDGNNPLVATDPTGASTVVWDRGVGAVTAGVAYSRAAGGAWSPAATIPGSSDAANAPQVVAAPDGTVTTAWVQPDAAGVDRIVSSRLVAGAWSTPVTLSVAGADCASPRLASDAAGVVTAAWLRTMPGTAQVVVRASRFADGAWSPVVTLSDGSTNASQLGIAAAGAGTATVVWRQSVGGHQAARAAQFAAGEWGAPARVSADGETASSVRVAAGSGMTLIGWDRVGAGPSGAGIARTAWSVPGGWSVPVDAAAVNALFLQGPVSVAVVAGSTGVVGIASPEGLPGVMSGAPLPWGAPSMLPPAGEGTWGAPAITPDALNGAHYAWVGGAGALQQVRVARATPAGVGATATLSSPDLTAFWPMVGVDAAAAATVAWFANPADGSPGSVVQVVRSSTVPTAPREPSATAAAARATITWTAPLATGNSPITGYSVVSAPDGRTCGAAGGMTSCTITGLANGTAYTFTVRATNAVGDGPDSQATSPVIPLSNGVRTGAAMVRMRHGAAVITTRVTVAGPGLITQAATWPVGASATERVWRTEQTRRRRLCNGSRSVTAAGSVTVTCTIGRRTMWGLPTGAVRVRLSTTFAPTGGTPALRTQTVRIRGVLPVAG